MEKLMQVLSAIFAVTITADQRKQIEEVVGKEFVAADDASKNAAKLDELTKQLAERDSDLEKLKASNKSEELEKQFDELNKKYAEATEKLATQETDYAAEKLLSGYKFASERVKKSVLEEFKSKGFKLENGAFIGGKEYLEELKKNEPDVFAKDTPELFMGSTQGNVSADANNLESQIFSGFGLKKD